MEDHMIPNQATHIITGDDLEAWLAEYGIDIYQTVEATIRLASSCSGRHKDAPPVHEVNAWLDVTWFKTNARGDRYVVHADTDSPDTDVAATGSSTIPLTSFPRLTPHT